MEVVVLLDKRIDTTNASEVENKIFEAIKGYDEVVLDAKNLTYISSAGLRIILKVKKTVSKTKVINCNSEIFEIFQTTGFTEMMSIEKAYREIDISNSIKIGQGSNGTVYQIGDDIIVKVYNNPESLDEIKRERELAKKAFVMGIPTAIPYDVVRVGNLYGSVFEMLSAKSFYKLINAGFDIDTLAKESVEILIALHSTKLKDNELPSKKEEALKWATFDLDYLDKEVGVKLLKLFNDIPECKTMLHGDFHVKNIMKQNGENLLIDMDTLSMGHPIFEFAAIYAAYIGYGCIDINTPQEFLNISLDNCKKFFDLTMKYYFKDKDTDFINKVIDMAKMICYTRILRRQIKRYGLDDKSQQNAINYCKKYITENIDKIDKLYY